MPHANPAQVILRRELQTRQLQNPAYSLRAFARKLAVSPSKLSDVLTGKQSLSLRVAKRVSATLQLDEDEARILWDQSLSAKVPAFAGEPTEYSEVQSYAEECAVTDKEIKLFRIVAKWCPVFNSMLFIHRLIDHCERKESKA